MKKCIKNSLIFLIFLLLILYLFVICSNHGAKNYVYSRNFEAKQIYQYLYSNESLFDVYCENYNIPKSGTLFLNGITNNQMDFFIEANEYYHSRNSISPNPNLDKPVYHYWTIKIIDYKVTDVWVYSVPLKQSQLKNYTFQEQINMIPLFGSNEFKYKSEYVIGYFNASKNNE